MIFPHFYSALECANDGKPYGFPTLTHSFEYTKRDISTLQLWGHFYFALTA